MPRMTFTQSLLGVVALTALVGTGCDQWLKDLAEAQSSNGVSTGKETGGPSMGTAGAPANAGSAGASGAAVSCKAVVNASGATCKECVDANGVIVYEACDSVPVGSGGTSGSGPVTDPGACITLNDGGPSSCKDAGTWMKYGTQACAQQKLTLTDLKPVTTCAGGNYESVTYVCCGGVPPSGAGPTPVVSCAQTPAAGGGVCQTCTDETGKIVKTDCPDGSPGSGGSGGSTGTGGGACTSIDDGGPTSCKDPATWKQYGIDRCGQQKLSLTDIKPQTMCAGGYASVTYVCCGQGSPVIVNPPTTCETSTNADGATCEVCKDANGKQVSAGCEGGTVPPNEICDVQTNADGSQCKTCYYADGTSVSSCPAPTAK